MCAYGVRLNDLDPIKDGLVFERFLNPELPSMPTFDVDFDERRCGHHPPTAQEKYGRRTGDTPCRL